MPYLISVELVGVLVVGSPLIRIAYVLEAAVIHKVGGQGGQGVVFGIYVCHLAVVVEGGDVPFIVG